MSVNRPTFYDLNLLQHFFLNTQSLLGLLHL